MAVPSLSALRVFRIFLRGNFGDNQSRSFAFHCHEWSPSVDPKRKVIVYIAFPSYRKFTGAHKLFQSNQLILASKRIKLEGPGYQALCRNFGVSQHP